MSAFVLYLDREHAKIFKLMPDLTEKLKMDKHIHHHHTSGDVDKAKDSTPFFKEVSEALKPASEILVLGHGIAKDQFVHFLEKHHSSDLAKKIVGNETVDKPTDNQVLDHARRFFKHLNLFR